MATANFATILRALDLLKELQIAEYVHLSQAKLLLFVQHVTQDTFLRVTVVCRSVMREPMAQENARQGSAILSPTPTAPNALPPQNAPLMESAQQA